LGALLLRGGEGRKEWRRGGEWTLPPSFPFPPLPFPSSEGRGEKGKEGEKGKGRTTAIPNFLRPWVRL